MRVKKLDAANHRSGAEPDIRCGLDGKTERKQRKRGDEFYEWRVFGINAVISAVLIGVTGVDMDALVKGLRFLVVSKISNDPGQSRDADKLRQCRPSSIHFHFLSCRLPAGSTEGSSR
jgi:hypothetical protein